MRRKNKAADVVKLLIAAALVVGGIWAFYALPGQPVCPCGFAGSGRGFGCVDCVLLVRFRPSFRRYVRRTLLPSLRK